MFPSIVTHLLNVRTELIDFAVLGKNSTILLLSFSMNLDSNFFTLLHQVIPIMVTCAHKLYLVVIHHLNTFISNVLGCGNIEEYQYLASETSSDNAPDSHFWQTGTMNTMVNRNSRWFIFSIWKSYCFYAS